MQKRVTHQIGDQVQAYDGRIGKVVYTFKEADSTFPDDQRVWIKCTNGGVMDALAEYFRAVTSIDEANQLKLISGADYFKIPLSK